MADVDAVLGRAARRPEELLRRVTLPLPTTPARELPPGSEDGRWRARLVASALARSAARFLDASLGARPPVRARSGAVAGSARPGAAAIARGRLERARRLDPWNETVTEWRARLEALEGRERRALALFRTLATRSRSTCGRAAGLAGQGEVFLARGRVGRAIRLFERSIAVRPGEPTARLRLAMALALASRTEASAAEFARVERIAGESGRTGALREVLGTLPAFVRLLEDSASVRNRLGSAAPGLLGTRPIESEGARHGTRRLLAATLREVRRLVDGARVPERCARRILQLAGTATGFPEATLARAADGGIEPVATFPARRGAPGRTAEETPGVRRGPFGVRATLLHDDHRLLLASPFAWHAGPTELAFVARVLRRLVRLFERAPSRGENALLARFPIGLRGRTAILLEPGADGIRLRVRAARGADAALAASSVPARGAGERVLSLPFLFPRTRSRVLVAVRFEGEAIGALAVEGRRRDLGSREGERVQHFAATLAPRLRGAQFSDWSRKRFGEAALLPPPGGVGARLAASVARAARAGGPILLEGETGVGKEVFARFAHFEGGGAGAFVPFACGEGDSPLAGLTLFGASRGAYTGCDRDRPGLLEAASGGTLFLDEVAILGLDAQASLLRALERGTVRRMGESAERPARFRLVAATRCDLRAEAASGRFREDLLHRIGRFRMRIPPLRERREEVPGFVRLFAARFAAREGRTPPSVRPDAVALLWRQEWEGNLRELESFLVRCFVWRARGSIDAASVEDAAARFRRPLRRKLPLRGPGAPAAIDAAIRTARIEAAPVLERASELLGVHPDTLARSLRDRSTAAGGAARPDPEVARPLTAAVAEG